jgi:D-beta-D-heptose 7-phosphate kinase/D-beta-D-heptose 1-phosphate adenosyltransferase
MKYHPDFSKCLVIVIGDIMLDRYYFGEVERISPEAPVPVVRVTQKTRRLGGAGNVILNLLGLACPAVLLGTVGDDSQGQYLTDILVNKDIRHHLVVCPGQPTTTKTRIMGQGQQLLRLDEEKPAALTEPARAELLHHLDKYLPRAGAVVLSDYAKGMFLGDLAQQVIARCKVQQTPVFVDPKGSGWQRYQGATCITPNEAELNRVAPFAKHDNGQLADQAHRVIDRYALLSLMVTRGPRGISLFTGKEPGFHIPTKAQEVFDVSGAGDTVIATLAAGVACGMTLAAAAELANAAAGVVVGKVGTHPIQAVELKNALMGKEITGMEKIVNRNQAAETADRWRREGKRVVFTNGCFDILHIGHMKLLRSAADQGDKLIVGVNSDASVKRLKGETRPIMPEEERAALLSNIESVDLVVLFSEDTPIELIRRIRPDILVKGGDYTPETVVGRREVESWGGRVAIVPIVKGVSTTQVIRQVQEKNNGE